ncbi:MAG: ComF family protein [Lachnospiraceae bacterium]|nr:ComF family protein [Lachnospiraceae bacterium]
MLRKIISVLLQILFPRVCPLCGMILPKRLKEADQPPFICASCREELSFLSEPGCLKCSRPVPEEEEYCEECKKKKRYFNRGRALLLHDDNARKILYDLKFQNRRDNADFIGYEMARQFAELSGRWKIEALIPVPLHKRRLRQRGFNQAETIANAFSYWLEKEAGMKIPVDTRLLRRIYATRPQRELGPEERMQNVQKAFRADPLLPANKSGYGASCGNGIYQTVCLIDDIYTSGATLDACAAALKKAGIRHVFFLTASIVP